MRVHRNLIKRRDTYAPLTSRNGEDDEWDPRMLHCLLSCVLSSVSATYAAISWSKLKWQLGQKRVGAEINWIPLKNQRGDGAQSQQFTDPWKSVTEIIKNICNLFFTGFSVSINCWSKTLPSLCIFILIIETILKDSASFNN